MMYNSKPANSSNYGGVRKPVEYIVVHYTGNKGDTAANNATYFAREGGLGRSSHYFVDEREVWASVPETATAWHCGTSGVYHHPYARNANSIGVEICMEDKTGALRMDAIKLAAEVVRDLMQRYAVPLDRVIRHYDVTHKECPAPMVHSASLWAQFKAMLMQPAAEQSAAKIYNKLTEVPAWGKPTVQKLIEIGCIAGDDKGALNLSEEMLRGLVITGRWLDAIERAREEANKSKS